MPTCFSHRVLEKSAFLLQKSTHKRTIVAVIGSACGLRGGTKRGAIRPNLSDRPACRGCLSLKLQGAQIEAGSLYCAFSPLGLFKVASVGVRNESYHARLPNSTGTVPASRPYICKCGANPKRYPPAPLNTRQVTAFTPFNRAEQIARFMEQYPRRNPSQETHSNDHPIRPSIPLGQSLAEQKALLTGRFYAC